MLLFLAHHWAVKPSKLTATPVKTPTDDGTESEVMVLLGLRVLKPEVSAENGEHKVVKEASVHVVSI
ncbi:hypothetical protein OJAV_G00173600 [Oryzias javanicus]|uniref:Uncharacterized protein n=1 Tax=Oryzias javanicus TaxID=123683 RepID=A0A437CG75_ORYJA|nr:hypothetical protein OJAV_G00173600 [Oryzias javanicus]